MIKYDIKIKILNSNILSPFLNISLVNLYFWKDFFFFFFFFLLLFIETLNLYSHVRSSLSFGLQFRAYDDSELSQLNQLVHKLAHLIRQSSTNFKPPPRPIWLYIYHKLISSLILSLSLLLSILFQA
jgi:hypothetical protein